MGDAPSKLFHAIVGLGLVAAGCGEVRTGSDDVDAGNDRGDVTHGQTGHADAMLHPDVSTIVDATADARLTFALDATTAHDAGVDAEAVERDAARAHDAAMDVTRPPPPEIK
jgi:hypothetical protein